MRAAVSMMLVVMCPVVASAGWPFKKPCPPDPCPPVCDPAPVMCPEPCPAVCPEPCPPPPPKVVVIEEEEAPPAGPRAAPRAGNYMQPYPTGSRAGESTSIGIRGFKIRIPEITFELPTIQLPSVVIYRRGPEFEGDSSRSPFVEGPVAGFSMTSWERRAAVPTPEPESRKAPEQPEKCEPPKPCVPIPSVQPGCSVSEAELRQENELQREQIQLLARQVEQMQKLIEDRLSADRPASNELKPEPAVAPDVRQISLPAKTTGYSEPPSVRLLSVRGKPDSPAVQPPLEPVHTHLQRLAFAE